ncbi:MAG: conjugal transfer protein TraG, partial [Sphingobacteriales bacterium]
MKKNTFESPYAGIGREGNTAILYGNSGSYSVIISIENPVLQYSADASGYEHFQSLLCNVVKLLGEGYLLQKQDVFSRQRYVAGAGNSIMQTKYNEHFDGRSYTALSTYLVLTRQVKKGAFYTYDKAAFLQFLQNCRKITDLLQGAQLSPEILDEAAVRTYVSQLSVMDFTAAFPSLNNIRSGDEQLSIGPVALRSLSLVDTDRIDLPESVAAFQPRSDEGSLRDFPNDHLSFLFRVPDFKTIIYNQVIEIPSQRMTLSK